jgi:hypothetical protein
VVPTMIAAGVGAVLAVTFTRAAEPDAIDMSGDVIIQDVAVVYPRPVAVVDDWYDGRLDDRHICADMRQALRMFPAGFSAWSSPRARAALRGHVEAHC